MASFFLLYYSPGRGSGSGGVGGVRAWRASCFLSMETTAKLCDVTS